MSAIQQTDIIELWQTVISCGTKKQFIVLLADGSHRCTCNLLITHGYPCRHFYKVLRSSSQAKWHIGLIASRWYKDDKVGFNFENTLQYPTITLCKDSVSENNTGSISTFDFTHIRQIRGDNLYTPILQEITSNRIKYGRAYGMMRKVIDIAISSNSYEELIGLFQNFLIMKQQTLNRENNDANSANYVQVRNPVASIRKGRPPGRAKSSVEIQDKQVRRYNPLTPHKKDNQNINLRVESENNIKVNQKTCQNCGKKGHNRATCKAKHS